MTVLFQPPGVPIPPDLQRLDDIAKACNQKIQDEEDKRVKQKKKKASCQQLGVEKHKCCDEQIAKDNEEKAKKGEKPTYEGERCYQRPRFDQNGQAIQPVNTTPINTDRAQVIRDAISSCGAKATREEISGAIAKALGGKIFPDAAIIGPGGEKTFVDFKFECPESHRSKKKSTQANYRPPTQSPNQAACHNALGQATGGGATQTIRF